jgi:hypothetical protein
MRDYGLPNKKNGENEAMTLLKRKNWIWKMSPRFAVLAITAISIIKVAAYATRTFAPAASNAPIALLPRQSHEFSTIMALSRAKATFVSTNPLMDVLVIDRIDRSCGCTSASCNRTVVPPGQTFNVDTILSARDYPESISSRVTLHGHAGGRLVEAEYDLHGNVENVIEFPESGEGYLRLGSWPLYELPATSVIAITRGKYPLNFDELRAECGEPALSASVEAVTSRSWRVHFTVNESSILGGSGYPITFRFVQNGKILPETVVKQAFVELLGPVAASPSSLLFTVTPGEHIRRTVNISRRLSEESADAPEVVSALAESKNVTASWQNDSRQSVVIIDYTAPTVAGSDRGDIVVSVLDQGRPYKLKLSYLALVS